MRIGFCRELIIVRRRHDRRHGGRLRVASRNDSFSLRGSNGLRYRYCSSFGGRRATADSSQCILLPYGAHRISARTFFGYGPGSRRWTRPMASTASISELTTKPVSPSSITTGTDPHDPAMMGVPAAIASIITRSRALRPVDRK